MNIPEVLEDHKKWLYGSGGKKADLSSADLRSANLSSANLRSADLSSADLSSANLSSANLRSADLRSADLSSANLRSANLRYADLSSADLSSANLSYANLSYADLRSADLSYAKYKCITVKKTPIQLYNLKYDILIFTNHIQIGCEFHKAKEWEKFTNKEIIAMDGTNALKFWERYKVILLEMCRQHRLDK